MNLEARPIVFEDMVRQILACGYRKRPEELLQEIGKFKIHCFHMVSRKKIYKYINLFILNMF